jgi:hypothetical protein
VYIQQLGRADIDTVMAVTTEQRLVSLHIQEVEKLFGVILPACNALAGAAPHATAAAPPAVRGTCSVLDLSGVGFGSLIKAKRLLTLFLALDAAYFPGGALKAKAQHADGLGTQGPAADPAPLQSSAAVQSGPAVASAAPVVQGTCHTRRVPCPPRSLAPAATHQRHA